MKRSTMTDRSFDDLALPDDLASLDAELRSISYEERPSFGPELLPQLERAWMERHPERHGLRRRLAVAVVAGLLLVGAGVPSARASLVRFMDGIQGDRGKVDEPSPTAPTPMQLAPLNVESPLVDPAPETGRTGVLLGGPATSPTAERSEWPAPTMPEIAERARAEDLIRRHYPLALQRAGIGGTVGLLLWVDSTGAVDFVNLGRGSGVQELDRAALEVAPSLRFRAASRRGRPVGTWVEFDVVFKPNPEENDPFSLPSVDPIDLPIDAQPFDPAIVPEWRGDILLPAPGQREGSELLRDAMGKEWTESRLGPIESILAGEPPAGRAPTAWRVEVGRALESAVARDPDNPAPLLALARLRRKQGLRTEARVLFERGLERAIRRGAPVSPTLVAELQYERGRLVEEIWLARRGSGRVRGDAFSAGSCPQARSSGGAATGFASVDRLIAWNYLCPGEFGDILDKGFETTDVGLSADLTVAMASFRAAVEAYPAHVGANIEILLALADEGRWTEVMDGARRFVWASKGHPYGLLLGGLALQRLGRSEEARDQFELAFRALSQTEGDELRDIEVLIAGKQREEYLALHGEARREWERAFWAPLDPILTSAVNEREVEHTARASYALLRFGNTLNDAAEVWLRYGRPTRVRVVSANAGVHTEFWDYGGGPDITFSRLGTAGNMDLTPEGRAYLNDLREVLPHRYGTLARTVFTLPAQLSRFRGLEPAAEEVEVDTEVPALLATGAEDTLDLGVFLLGADGSKISVTQRRIRAQSVPMSLRTPVAPEVSSVVVEFFNRRTGQAASLRDAARLTGGEEAGPSVSDLLIMKSVAPGTEPVTRSADWVEPLSLVRPVDVDAVGVYFELYDLAPLASWYRLKVEIVNRDTGAVVGVPIRPAGEEGYRPTWDRYPSTEGPTVEFLSVALTDVPPGRHTLRVVADVPEAGTAVIATRDFDRR
jgi:TonB family protein